MSIKPTINSSSKERTTLEVVACVRGVTTEAGVVEALMPTIEGSGVGDDTITLAGTDSAIDVKVGTVIITEVGAMTGAGVAP